MRKKNIEKNQPHKRDGRRPRVEYERPVRDRVVKICLSENRRPTSPEIVEISRETHRLAKLGYYLLSMMDEDKAVIDELFPDDINPDDDDKGASGYNLGL